MTWPNFDGKPYTRDALAARIASLNFNNWRRKDGSRGRPQFITLHNTSTPDIGLWLSWSPEKRASYINNIDDWYARKGWKAGPHFFVPPTTDPVVFGFSDPQTCGTHCSCFNSDSIGIEMVGEFNREPFDSGPGAIVRDNAVYLMALLHRKIGMSPDTIRFHVECKADNHDCPGRFVQKGDVIARVKAAMADLAASPTAPSRPAETPPAPGTGPAAPPVPPIPQNAPVPAPTAARRVIFEVHGKMSTFGGPNDTGMRTIEGLALWSSAAQMVQHGLGEYLVASPRFPGLGRQLNPDKAYLACRWDYRVTPVSFLQNAVAYVTDSAGKVAAARPVDWGPHERTGRVADLSPGLAKLLDLDTNEICTVRIYEDGK